MTKGVKELWSGVAQRAKIQISPDFLEASRYNELLSILSNGSFDICLNAVALCCDRWEMFDFALPYYERWFTMTLLPPEISNDIFLEQFESRVWIALLIVIILLLLGMELANFVLEHKLKVTESIRFVKC